MPTPAQDGLGEPAAQGEQPSTSAAEPPVRDPVRWHVPVDESLSVDNWEFLSGGRTFEPLIADLRWPRFGASQLFYSGGRYLNVAQRVSVGDTIALARGPLFRNKDGTGGAEIELGLQSAVFSLFNPIGNGPDLINIDYVAGAYAAARRGPWSGTLRLWHISSHVGDEFLINEEFYPGGQRESFKLEQLQVLASYDATDALRVYGGANWLFDYFPNAQADRPPFMDYGAWILQWGVELNPPITLFGGTARPVFAADLQHRSGRDFVPNASFRGGLSFDGGYRRGPRFQLLAECYIGDDPNGHFWTDDVITAGVGMFFNL